jgi:molybdopterin-synthase adenylyltransferase
MFRATASMMCGLEPKYGPKPSFDFRLRSGPDKSGSPPIHCHSHPTQRGAPTFSATDTRSEKQLAAYAAERVPDVTHAALLIGADGVTGRELGTTKAIEVWQVGPNVRRFFPQTKVAIAAVHDRQVRAFGTAGQLAIQSLRVALVGCGGTGSIVAQELAHLGATNLLLVDPDRLTKTNLNRVVGATPADLGRFKVDIARRMIRRIAPNAVVTTVKGDVLKRVTGKLLLDYDLIFCCTDSDGSRHFLNQLAVPVFHSRNRHGREYHAGRERNDRQYRRAGADAYAKSRVSRV